MNKISFLLRHHAIRKKISWLNEMIFKWRDLMVIVVEKSPNGVLVDFITGKIDSIVDDIFMDEMTLAGSPSG